MDNVTTAKHLGKITTRIHPTGALANDAHKDAASAVTMAMSLATIPEGQVWKTYYYASSQRVAMRVQDDSGSDELYYLFSEHLGSTSITTDSEGNLYAEMRYKAWGVVRYTSGDTPTNYTYTGQRSEVESFGLMYYKARWYDPASGRFAQADSIIPEPGNPIAWDRYAYSRNNSVKYVDPSGYWSEEELNNALGSDWRKKYFSEDAVFGGRENLLLFLNSEDTTDKLSLLIISSIFSDSYNAYQLGIELENIDAVGYRGTFSVGATGFIAVSGDAILNLNSGEFSLFIAPEGGLILGDNGSFFAGLLLISNLPNNSQYRGTSKAAGVVGGYLVGLTAEKYWGGVHYDQHPSDVYNGSFVGSGLAVPEIGIYGSLAYSVEVLNVNIQGQEWMPNLPGFVDALSDVGKVLLNDIFHIRP